MKNLNLFFLLVVAIMISSCEQEVAISQIEVRKDVVVNSTFSPNKEFEVTLTYTRNILDNNSVSEVIDDAIVMMYDEEGHYLFELEHTQDGVYQKENLYPIEDKYYNIEIKVDGYDLISASSRIPSQVEVTNVTTNEVEVDGEIALKVDFDIIDLEEVDNFYIWEIISSLEIEYAEQGSENVVTIYNDNFQPLEDGEGFQNQGTRWSKLFASDLDFSGNVLNTSFLSYLDRNFEGAYNPNANTENPINVHVQSYLKVVTASSDLYHYYISVEQFLKQKEINSSAIVPVKLHSNINGGLGIFAGFNEQLIEI